MTRRVRGRTHVSTCLRVTLNLKRFFLLPNGASTHVPINRGAGEHRHSKHSLRHPGAAPCRQDSHVLAARHSLYQGARQRIPQRWSDPTRNWTPAVTLCFLVPTWQSARRGHYGSHAATNLTLTDPQNTQGFW